MPPESNDACKIDRVAERRSLTAIDDRLRDGFASGDSLRDLERRFNEAVLRSALAAANVDTVDGEISNLYRLLTDDEVSAGQRIDAEARLERDGLDPAEVSDDFVSYGTVRTHLNDCLGVDTDRSTAPSADEVRTTVRKLVSRTESVAARSVERLADRTGLTIPAPSVSVSVRVACLDCNSEYTFSDLLTRGGCACSED